MKCKQLTVFFSVYIQNFSGSNKLSILGFKQEKIYFLPIDCFHFLNLSLLMGVMVATVTKSITLFLIKKSPTTNRRKIFRDHLIPIFKNLTYLINFSLTTFFFAQNQARTLWNRTWSIYPQTKRCIHFQLTKVIWIVSR